MPFSKLLDRISVVFQIQNQIEKEEGIYYKHINYRGTMKTKQDFIRFTLKQGDEYRVPSASIVHAMYQKVNQADSESVVGVGILVQTALQMISYRKYK